MRKPFTKRMAERRIRMRFENENNGMNINITNNETEKEIVNQTVEEQQTESSLYHFTPEEMRATGNNTYYNHDYSKDEQGNQNQDFVTELSMNENQSFNRDSHNRQPANYGNYSSMGGEDKMKHQYQDNEYSYQYHEPSGDGMPPIKDKKRKSKDGFGKKATKFVASAVVFGLVAGVVFQGVNYGADYFFGGNKNDIQLSTTNVATGNSVSTSGSVAQVAQSTMPAIVAITSTVESIQNGFFGQQYKTEGTGSGSGIIISKDNNNLYIATNNHVIEDATKVQVTFYHDPKADGSGEVVNATIVGTDPDSDLAVVKVALKDMSTDTLNEIKIASLGDSDQVEIGQQVVAIGNALGYGQSVTSGYVSALNRQVQLEDKTMTLMQTDAAINPGNSGGALIDMNGDVIGINSAKYSESGVEGMGYAIPMATAKPILEDIMNESSIPEEKQAYLGITGSTVSDQYRQYMGNNKIPSGVYVATVTADSPAEKGGIYANDIIVKFNDREVSTMDGLQSLLSRKQAGDTVKVVVKRQNQNGEYEEKELTVTLGKKTESIKNQQEQQEQQNNSNNSGNYYGNSGSSQEQEEFWSFFN